FAAPATAAVVGSVVAAALCIELIADMWLSPLIDLLAARAPRPTADGLPAVAVSALPNVLDFRRIARRSRSDRDSACLAKILSASAWKPTYRSPRPAARYRFGSRRHSRKQPACPRHAVATWPPASRAC